MSKPTGNSSLEPLPGDSYLNTRKPFKSLPRLTEAAMSNGDYTLSGSFWSGVVNTVHCLYRLYLPLILKNYGP